MKRIKFGTDGWRAVMADEFTFSNVKLVTQAIAHFLQEHPLKENGVIIGYDNRFLSEHFAAEVAKVMAGNGIKALVVNRATPTPVTAFAITTYQACGAVMLTASHNPPEYNGIKFIPEYAGPALPAVTDRIEEELAQVIKTGAVRVMPLKEAGGQGLYEEFDPMPPYKKHLKKLIDLDAISRANLKIFVDPMYGAGINYLDEIFAKAGCPVTALHNFRDPLFGGSLPEPSARVLGELRERVLEEKADLGLALDGDADRFGVIDTNGDYLVPNKVLSLLYYHLLTARGLKGPVARTVATTHLLDRMARSFGFQVDETPVGFKYIGESMMKRGSIMGGEESGGLSIQGHIPEKDGILACLLMAEIRAVHGQTLSEILHRIEKEFGGAATERLDLRVEPQEKERISGEIKSFAPETFSGRQVRERCTKDGLKLILEDGSWLLIRASGTEPLFRIYVETDSQKRIKEIQDQVIKQFGMK
jgi:alpha-D-glucose phosphate-specific phosphoglucomutase